MNLNLQWRDWRTVIWQTGWKTRPSNIQNWTAVVTTTTRVCIGKRGLVPWSRPWCVWPLGSLSMLPVLAHGCALPLHPSPSQLSFRHNMQQLLNLRFRLQRVNSHTRRIEQPGSVHSNGRSVLSCRCCDLASLLWWDGREASPWSAWGSEERQANPRSPQHHRHRQNPKSSNYKRQAHIHMPYFFLSQAYLQFYFWVFWENCICYWKHRKILCWVSW